MKIIIDTDIGEDIDDILACALALVSPEFEVMAITVSAGDVQARSRIARRLTATVGRPEVPVAAGYGCEMPGPETPFPPGAGVRQGELAETEEGLPPSSELRADDLVAELAAEHPGEISVLTIGGITNVGWALVRHPETATKLRAVISNGGLFGGERTPEIGWNLRYDILAAATVSLSQAPWVLLSESCTGSAGLREEEVQVLRASARPLPQLLVRAIDLWKQNKADATPFPHVSDLNVLAYLLGWVETRPGLATLSLTPGRLPGLAVAYLPEGRHQLGGPIPRDRGAELRTLFMERILS